MRGCPIEVACKRYDTGPLNECHLILEPSLTLLWFSSCATVQCKQKKLWHFVLEFKSLNTIIPPLLRSLNETERGAQLKDKNCNKLVLAERGSPLYDMLPQTDCLYAQQISLLQHYSVVGLPGSERSRVVHEDNELLWPVRIKKLSLEILKKNPCVVTWSWSVSVSVPGKNRDMSVQRFDTGEPRTGMYTRRGLPQGWRFSTAVLHQRAVLIWVLCERKVTNGKLHHEGVQTSQSWERGDDRVW